LTANKVVVDDIKAALPALFAKNANLEHRVIAEISNSKLLSLARAHEQDALGVEIMQYVNACFENCVGHNLHISRLNASSLDNVSSVQENNEKFFQNSTAFENYDYGLTGRINKVDGLFVYHIFAQQRSVYRWLLNLEVDGQDKTNESFSCAMKMWQAVDINRARTPDAITFTLRANLYKMHTHRFNDANKILRRLFRSSSKHAKHTGRKKPSSRVSMSGVSAGDQDDDARNDTDDEGELESLASDSTDDSDASDDIADDDINDDDIAAGSSTRHDSRTQKNLISSKDSLRMQLETALYMLRTYANAHVYFVCEMLRFICREGKLYEELYADFVPGNHISTTSHSARKATRPIYDIHCFLGAFTLEVPNEIRIQENQPVPYDVLPGDNKGGKKNDHTTTCRWKQSTVAHHKSHGVCTVPSFTNSQSALWQNWTARVQCIALQLPLNLQDVPLRFICVQRVKMQAALSIMREESEKKTDGKSWNLLDNAKITQQFNGMWYVQDIVDFLLSIQSYVLSTWKSEKDPSDVFTWEKFNSVQRWTDVGLTPDTDKANLFLNSLPKRTAQEQLTYDCYNKLKIIDFCAEKYNRFVGRSTNKMKNDKEAKDLLSQPFYPNNTHATQSGNIKTKHGYYYVIQGVADEMLNALFSLFSKDLGKTKSKGMRIRWHEKDPKYHILIQPILKNLKLIRRDVDARVTDRKEFLLSENDNWEKQKSSTEENFLPQSSWAQTGNASLNANVLRSMDRTLPHIERGLALYVQRQNIPGSNLFLRALRVYNFVAARELWTQVQTSEALKARFDEILSIFPVGVQSELINLLRTLQQDDTMLAIEIQKILHTIPPYTNWSSMPVSISKKPLGLLGKVMHLLSEHETDTLLCDVVELRNTNYYRHLLLLQTQTQIAPALNLQNIMWAQVPQSVELDSASEHCQLQYSPDYFNGKMLVSKQLNRLRTIITNFHQSVKIQPPGWWGDERFLVDESKPDITRFFHDNLNITVDFLFGDSGINEKSLRDFKNFMGKLQNIQTDEFFQDWCMPAFLEHYEVQTLLCAMTRDIWQATQEKTTHDLYVRQLENRDVVIQVLAVQINQDYRSSSDFESVDLPEDTADDEDEIQRSTNYSVPALLIVTKKVDETMQIEMFSENLISIPIEITHLTSVLIFDDVELFTRKTENNAVYSMHNHSSVSEMNCTIKLHKMNLNNHSTPKQWEFKEEQELATFDNLQCIDLTCTALRTRSFWGIFKDNHAQYHIIFWRHAAHKIQQRVALIPTTEPRILTTYGNCELFTIENDKKIVQYRLQLVESGDTCSMRIQHTKVIDLQSICKLEAFSLLKYSATVFASRDNHSGTTSDSLTLTTNITTGFDIKRVQQSHDLTLTTHTFKFRIDDATSTLTCQVVLDQKLTSNKYRAIEIQADKYWMFKADTHELHLDVWGGKKNRFYRMPLLHVDKTTNLQYTLTYKLPPTMNNFELRENESNSFVVSSVCTDFNAAAFRFQHSLRDFEHFTTLKPTIVKNSRNEILHWCMCQRLNASMQLHNTSPNKGMAKLQEFETVMRFYSVRKWDAAFAHRNNKGYLSELAQQMLATSWLHLKNCFAYNLQRSSLLSNIQPIAVDAIDSYENSNKVDWLQELLALHMRDNDMCVPMIDPNRVKNSKLALMSTNIIVHFTSTKWRDTLFCAKILLSWFFYAVLQEGVEKVFRKFGERSGPAKSKLGSNSVRSERLEPLEINLKKRRKLHFAHAHKKSVASLHRRIALQIYAPVIRGQHSASLDPERDEENKTRAWNPGLQTSPVNTQCLHANAATKQMYNCAFESFVRADNTQEIAHDHAFLLVFAQYRLLMQAHTTLPETETKKALFEIWKTKQSTAQTLRKKSLLSQIEKNILALRLHYFFFLRTMVADLQKKSLQNLKLRIATNIAADITSDESKKNRQTRKKENLQLQFLMQGLAQQLTDTFIVHITNSTHHSLLLHLKWKRLLIKRLFIARVQYAVWLCKYSRLFFETTCQAVQQEDLPTLAKVDNTSSRCELDSIVLMFNTLPNFDNTHSGKFFAYQEQIKKGAETVQVDSAYISGLYALLDFLLHKHQKPNKTKDGSVMLTLPEAHQSTWKYLKTVLSMRSQEMVQGVY
jgi:hypothetical protein